MYKLVVPTAGILVALIVVHGLFPEEFLVDSTTIGLLVLLAAVLLLPRFAVVRRYISELNLFGSGVKFREEVSEAAEQAEALATKTKQNHPEHRSVGDDHESEQPPPWPVFVDIGQHLYRLIDEDPRLAIVGLGIEVERAVLELVRGTGLVQKGRYVSLPEAVSLLRGAHRIDAEEEGLLALLMRLRSGALEGVQLDKKDAQSFFTAVESLNSFSVGYSLNLKPNEHWKEQGLICRFEHCIERMPLKHEPWEGSCGFFGHDCPGGTTQVATCASLGLFDFPGSAHSTALAKADKNGERDS